MSCPESEATAVEIRGLEFSYRRFLGGRIPALRGVDLRVEGGELCGLLGLNGSGKTSLLRCVLGLARPDAGACEVLGRAAGAREALQRIGALGEGRLPFDRLSGRGFLLLTAALAGLGRDEAREKTETLLARFGLTAAADRAHRSYSSGMERRLAIAQAFLEEPALLVLDEPNAALDPEGVALLREALAEHAARGGSALVATNSLEDMDEGFTSLCVLLEGRVVARGRVDEILRVTSGKPARESLGSLLRRVRAGQEAK